MLQETIIIFEINSFEFFKVKKIHVNSKTYKFGTDNQLFRYI